MSKKIYVWIVHLVLVGAVFLILILFDKSKQFYKREQKLQLYPVTIISTDSTIQVHHDSRPMVILFGDSRVSQWDETSINSNYNVINMGVSAQTTAQLLIRLKEDVLDYKPDIVVIQAGINDLKTLGIFEENQQEIVNHCKDNIYKIVSNLKAAGIQTLLMEILPPTQISFPRTIVFSDETYSSVANVNEWMYSLEDSLLTVVECNHQLVADKKLLIKYSTDELHINNDGYNIVNDCINKYLTLSK